MDVAVGATYEGPTSCFVLIDNKFNFTANALSTPPGEYGRKIKTQRNWRGFVQAVEHVI